jgi:hypothetical protein
MTASVSRLCFISESVCQCHLGNLSRIVCRLGAPVPTSKAIALIHDITTLALDNEQLKDFRKS